MLIFVARYFVLLTLSIGSNQGEELQMPNMDTLDLNIFKISGCISRCMHEEKRQQQEQSFLKSCYDHCIVQNATTLGSVRKIQENLQLKLVCRDDRSLSFRIDTETASLMTVSNSTALSNIATVVTAPASAMNATTIAKAQSSNITDSPTIYVVKIHLAKDTQECFVYMTDDNFFTIDTLKPYSNYNITAVAVHANSEYSIITRNEMYATLVGGYTPGMILETEVKNFRADVSNAMRLTAEIAWKPAADTTCHYNVISYSHLIPDYDVIPWDLRYTRTHTHAFILDNLTFSTEYDVGIRAINANNTSKESDIFWTTIHVPSCLKWHHKNYNICAPLPPEGLHVEQFLIGEDQYSLNISWDQPEISPSYYVLRIFDLFENGSSYLANVSQLQTSVFLQNVTLFGPMFDAHLSAYTPGGNATSYKTNSKKHGPVPKKQNIVKLISAIFAPMLCIVILLLTTFTICHRRAKLKRYRERCKYFEELEKKAPIDPKSTFKFTSKALSEPPTLEDLTQLQLDLEEKICFNDAMEIERDDVTLHELLGEGAFGMVRRGIYQDLKLGAREVAVKMLKDHPTLDDVRAFRCEIEVMKSVERHPNIVGIIGHCTKRCTEMLLLTEYCSFGNLLNFLRNEWKYLHELNAKVDVVSLPPTTTTHNKGNIGNRSSNKMAQLPSPPPPPPPTQRPHTNHQSCHNKNHNKQINHNNNNIVQQFDTTLIGKIKQKYRTFNGSNSNDSSSNANATTKSNVAKEQQQHRHIEELNLMQPTIAVATAAENKSYGYDEICSNSCKCQVDILTIKDVAASQDAEQLERLLQHSGNTTTVSLSPITTASAAASRAATTIQIKNCDCNIAQKNQKNKASSPPTPVAAPMLSIENKGYYKNLLEQVITLKNTISAEATKPTQNDRINSVHTKLNEELSSSLKREPLVASDLLDIAKQVAIGMEFLAKNKVVHRDLAARNVLVAPDRTIKIADFGLSRDVYQENIYKKTGNGKLPIKWLALESMTHQVYTTQSDVWSYGILLYEIVTLGGTPYPSIPTNRLLHLLKSGYRMEKPKNCGLEFYDLMYSCWNINTGERPNFTQIIKTLDKLLLCEVAEENSSQTLEIETISATKVQSTEPLCSDDSYLKPLHYVSPSASPPSPLD